MRTAFLRRIALAALIAIGFCSCRNPEKDFERAKQADTAQSYAAFVKRYPESPRVAEAQAALARIAFAAAEQANTEQAFALFLEQYPASAEAARAGPRLEALALQNAEQVGTEAAFLAFLERFPKSAHAGKAQERLEEVAFRHAEQAGTEQAFLSFLHRFPHGAFTPKAQARCPAKLGEPQSIGPWEIVVVKYETYDEGRFFKKGSMMECGDEGFLNSSKIHAGVIVQIRNTTDARATFLIQPDTLQLMSDAGGQRPLCVPPIRADGGVALQKFSFSLIDFASERWRWDLTFESDSAEPITIMHDTISAFHNSEDWKISIGPASTARLLVGFAASESVRQLALANLRPVALQSK